MAEHEPLSVESLASALAVLLATPGTDRVASRTQVDAFLNYLQNSRITWEGWRVQSGHVTTGLFLALLLPGSTAVVMVPSPGELGIDPDVQRRLTAAGMAALTPRRLHYAQALLAPRAEHQQRLLEATGFRPLAPLVYLERGVTYPWIDPPPADLLWVPFSDATRAEFARALLATYEDSADCPELSGLRPIDDVIAAHQTAGRFDPALWELLRIGDRDAGALLLAHLAHITTVEVVYMGVVPGQRRRGVGGLLLRRALQRCREVAANRLTLVVDDRNAPAKRLYQRFALRPVARREAFFYRWPAAKGAPPAPS